MTNLTTSPHHRHNLTTSGSAGNDDTLDLVLAVVFTVASAAANSLGLVMQKWAKKPCGLWWIFGNLVFQSGSLLMAAGLAFGEQLLVAPLGALVMVFNIPFSHCFLKEKASPWDILGSVFIMAGVICVALFGPVSDTKPTADQLDDLLLRPVFIGVESSILVFMLVVALVAHFEAKKVISDHEVKIAFAALHEPLAAGFLGEEGSSSDYGLSHHERPAGTDDDEVNTKTAEPESLQLQLDSFRSYFLFFGYAILMAMSSGFLMCAAQLLEILVIDAVNNKTGPNLATNGLFWGPLVFLVVFLVLQSKFANNGLRVCCACCSCSCSRSCACSCACSCSCSCSRSRSCACSCSCSLLLYAYACLPREAIFFFPDSYCVVCCRLCCFTNLLLMMCVALLPPVALQCIDAGSDHSAFQSNWCCSNRGRLLRRVRLLRHAHSVRFLVPLSCSCMS